jgi:hypothetical protein
METKRYSPVGKCIYCGSTSDLGDEHIVPYSLMGLWVLPKASCRNCEKITSAFEGKVARDLFEPLRIKLDFPTKRPKDRKTHLPMFSSSEPDPKTPILVPAKDSLGGVVFVHFAPPGYVRNPPERPKTWLGCRVQHQSLMSDKSKWPKGVDSFRGRPIPFDALGRMIAKIAHAFVVSQIGVDSFEHWLPPYILGHDTHLAYLVGGLRPEWSRDQYFLPVSVYWQLQWGIQDRPPGIPTEELPRVPVIFAFMWFLGPMGNSPYCAVVGRATEEFMANRKGNLTNVDSK